MRRILKIAIYTAIFFYFIFILYIFFSPTEKTGSEKTNTTKTTSTKTAKKSTKQIPVLKENKKNIQNEKILYVQMCPSCNKKTNKPIIDSYVLCGDDIQSCPPPMPPAKCSCKASNNFFNMFDGKH